MYRKIGKSYLFEYHCLESEKSSDAELWHRTRQRVKILSIVEKGGGDTKEERLNAGHPAVYEIKFSDGHVRHAFEDEILGITSIEIARKFLEMIKAGHDFTYDYIERFAGYDFRQSGIIRLHKTGHYLDIRIERDKNNKEKQTFLFNDRQVLLTILSVLSKNLMWSDITTELM